ncbi:MAG: hypothetical protein GY815_13140 [Gammaproteobacteria bacterium]|nr:hypothetical protein [Gammaproteobacteria bacterium]
MLWHNGDDSIWHENLKNSDGLKTQTRKPIDIGDPPTRLRALYDDFLPHYRQLYAHRLRS